MVSSLLLGIAALVVDDLPIVEAEESVYSYTSPSNGSGPMWCSGSTCIVRVDDRVFASGIETVEDVPPLNNVRWTLWVRDTTGWHLVRRDEEGLTREPSPLAYLGDGRLLLSVNPTLNPHGTEGGGPARPEVLCFDARDPGKTPTTLLPTWDGQPGFTEHSYRSFAADATRHEAFLLQNVGYEHAEWSFLDAAGRWPFCGKLVWPRSGEPGADYPLRLCYPNVALHERAVYFCGVSDIIEPNPEWRAFKRQLTGQDWDYDFRRLFFTSCPDISTGRFSQWVEIASREATCGWITPGDLLVSPDGRVHLLWTERAIDERLRERFFPSARQRYTLEYAVVQGTEVIMRQTLIEGGDGLGGLVPGLGRFHVTPSGTLYVFCYVGGADDEGRAVSANWLLRLGHNGEELGRWVVPLTYPLSSFFVAGPRSGSTPSEALDILGEAPYPLAETIRYARVRPPELEG